MHNRYSYLSFLLLTFVLAACGGQSASNTNVSGTWSGQISGPGGTSPLTLQLAQTDLALNGTLRLGEGQLAVSGTLAGNLVSLSGQAGSETLQLAGSVSDSTMQGTISVTDTAGQSATVDFMVTKD